MSITHPLRRCLVALAAIVALVFAGSATAGDLKLLFLGDNGPHRPADRFEQLAPVLEQRGIQIVYTDDVGKLNAGVLNQFDGLILYANIDKIEPAAAEALLEYVSSGRGFIPLHCASFCFRNSPDVVALIGAQFKTHGIGPINTQVVEPRHPVMQEFGGFRSIDESYVHTLHNEKNRIVLEYRVGHPQADGNQREPWTWVRTHGQGRVFYTAWGHDERTWSHPGFQNLVERGIRWSCGQDPRSAGPVQDAGRFAVPEMTSVPANLKPFEYVDVGQKIPFYTAGRSWGAQETPRNMMQKPLPPEDSRQHFVTPVNLEVQLFVSEENLEGKPIAMNWDERGRLWICETIDYPNELQAPPAGHDRIRICEDADGDGKADRFTLFADHLSIPTALVFARGGVVVHHGTQTLFLKDADGDDRADVRTVLISNWTLGDTHGGVSNLRCGLDNWIWGMQGYNQSSPVVNGQQQQSFRQGFFRFKLDNADPPQVAELEFVRSTDNNTWGLGISEEGLIFGSTANHNPSVFMPIPNRYYERVRNWSPPQLGSIADTFLFQAVTDKIRQVDNHGGYTAGAGHALYTARSYPETWWNKTAFVCEPTGHLVGTFVLQRDGAAYHSSSPCNLLASDDEWSAPVVAEVGPDGQVWVIDWYNYIVQHNPTPEGFTTGKGKAYESDLRDKKHGRIYRVVNKAASPDVSNGVKLDSSRVPEIVAALSHPSMVCRLHAQRLLIERGKLDVVPQLIKLVQNPSTDAIGLNVGAIHALWTLQGLGELNRSEGPSFAAVAVALKHPSAGVRRNAFQVLPPGEASTRLVLDSDVAQEQDAQAQLAAILALSDMPESTQAGTFLATLAQDPKMLDDRWLPDALTSAAAVHARGFLIGLAHKSAASPPDMDAPLLDKTLKIANVVCEHLSGSRPSAETLQSLFAPMAAADPQLLASMLDGMSAGWPRDHAVQLNPQADALLISLLDRVPARNKAQLVKLSSRWGSVALQQRVETVLASLFEVVESDQAGIPERIASARQLIEFQPDNGSTVDRLLKLVSPQTAPDLATGILNALNDSTSSELASKLIVKATTATPAQQTAAIRVLLSRPQTTGDLLTAIEAGKLRLSDLSLEQRQALSNHPNVELQARARKLLSAGGGLPNPDREKVVHEKLHLTERHGNVELGKALFKKNCSKCHRHSGEGVKIGPDLTGMAVHPKKELLVHLLDPSRSVEGNFRSYTVVLLDGRILNGMLAGETRTSIELIDSEARPHAVARQDIEELISSRTSLMPEGFEKQMTDEELVDLLEFLTDKGRFLPVPLERYATIVTTRGMFHSEEADGERLVFENWQPKTFAGVPFVLTDPQGGTVPNAIMLYGPLGKIPPRMPRDVSLPCHTPARAIHLLSGVSGWGATAPGEKGVAMIVRLHYADGQSEDHPLIDGQHFADYIRVIDVPQSQLAFQLSGKQLRYLSVQPKRQSSIETIEFVKGEKSPSAPIVMAVTIETQK
ncbi:PVC-type heme-binding CxxCH protein [Planctomicrobium piriforme]|uniref:Cytochrome c domain-containing protein n=1 Tax=Planctomicrobium piriforme TaxID=1576369 RepID=A0A1I3AVB9_9PLAN|nr:PVC-type heme-binding CxxCH protein [Planctomicrobium piriforme]SFH53281.1 hypothetical protein SAMN05421753_10147 [Planctomicrobium piriforme]